MIDKAMWEALWHLYPAEMAFLCVKIVLSAVLLVILIFAMAVAVVDDGKEDELWEN